MQKTDCTMFNFSNEDYLDLLNDIRTFFVDKVYFGFDDTVIRYDEETMSYIASVYLLDA